MRRLLAVRIWRWPAGRLLVLGLGVALVVYALLVARAIVWPVRMDMAPLPPPAQGEPVLVIAPHEDDETLGCGDYLREAAARGAPVWVCLLTCGEGEELGTAVATKRPLPSAAQFVKLGQIRQQESLRVLRGIGVPEDHVLFLGYPNMGLRWMWSATNWGPGNLWRSPYTKTDHSPFDNSVSRRAPFCGAAVTRDLQAVMMRVRPHRIFTTHPADIHPDHWATYCFTRLALEEIRACSEDDWPRQTQLLTYLVHRRGWPAPWGYYPELRLTPPRALIGLPANDWFRWDLARPQALAKNRMILGYRSQAARFDLLLRAFARRNELFAEIHDASSGLLPPWLQPDVGLEPRGETEYLRRHPGADLVHIETVTTGAKTSVIIRTAAPVSRAQLIVMLTAIAPEPGGVRCALVQLRHGRAPEAWIAGDATTAQVASPLVRVDTVGATVTVTVPNAWLGPGQRYLLDVLSVVRNHTVDHSLTHVVGSARGAAVARP